jgi:hypothetical protein
MDLRHWDFPPESRGTSGLQMGLGCGEGPGPGCLDSQREGGLVSPWEIHQSLSGQGVCHFGLCL